MKIEQPYLLFVGDAQNQEDAKMAIGITHWTPENVVGKLSFPNCKAKVDAQEMSIAEAVQKGAKTFVIGLVNAGGIIPQQWFSVLFEALEAGLDIAAGMHTRLNDLPELKAAADRLGRKLFDVRYPDQKYPIGKGLKRTGKRLLAVGTDCSVGKMFTTLAITKAMKEMGLNATFRASGQTGIMIAGEGLPIDAVISDFVAGAAEVLSPNNDENHWDIVEGQGSLTHPSFAGVTIGLLHGSQPDAIVVCHHATRAFMRGLSPQYPLVSVKDCIELNLNLGRLTNPNIRCIGVSVNTSEMEMADALEYLKKLEDELDLPCVDPLRTGVAKLIGKIIEE